jgi:FK506-binding protein 1
MDSAPLASSAEGVIASKPIVLSTGVSIVTLRAGNATHYPKKGSTCRMEYTARVKGEEKAFDSSRSRGKPLVFRFGVGQLIQGLDDAIGRISKGTKCLLEIPPNRAYGARGFPPMIPPNATLEYEIELLAIE